MGLEGPGAAVANVSAALALIVTAQSKFDNGALSNGALFHFPFRPGHRKRYDVRRQFEANSLNIAFAQAHSTPFAGLGISRLASPPEGPPFGLRNLGVALRLVQACQLIEATRRDLVAHLLDAGAAQRASPVKILGLATARKPLMALQRWQLSCAVVACIHMPGLSRTQVVGTYTGDAVRAELTLEQHSILHVWAIGRPKTVGSTVLAEAGLGEPHRDLRNVQVIVTIDVGSPPTNRTV